MGKLVVTEFVSLDGVFEDPGGAEAYEHGGWTFKFDRGADGGKYKLDEVFSADAQLLGRVTYEGFAKAWPTIKDDAGFADKFNSMPKYVVSSTLKEATWNNSTVISSDPAKEVAALKERYAGDILVSGSGTLVQWLMSERLVDELHLMVFPVVLGSGRTLWAGGRSPGASRLSLATVREVGGDGVIIVEYTVEGAF